MDAQSLGETHRIEIPPAGGVRVWLIRASPELAERSRAVLSADEQADVDRLARERDRLAATVSRAAWRQAAGNALGIEPGDVEVERTGYGRPLPVGLERTVTDLNSSHAADLVGLAVGRGVRIGVDLEMTTGVQVDDHISHAVESITGPAIELIQDRTERILFAWSVLEALLKADGRGMHLSPSMVSTEIRTLWGWNAARVAGTAWWVRRFETPGGFVGAVAAAGPVVDIDFIRSV
jgi:phosphopantetheinyl transferase